MRLLRNGSALHAALFILFALAPRALPQQGERASLNVYYSNDLIGYLTPCG